MSAAATINVDLSDAVIFRPRPRLLAPIGDYRFRIEEAKFHVSSKKKTKAWQLTLEVLNGPVAGQRLVEEVWLTQKNKNNILSFLTAVHPKKDWKSSLKLPANDAGIKKLLEGQEFGGHLGLGEPYTRQDGSVSQTSEIEYYITLSDLGDPPKDDAPLPQVATTAASANASDVLGDIDVADDSEPDVDDTADDDDDPLSGLDLDGLE